LSLLGGRGFGGFGSFGPLGVGLGVALVVGLALARVGRERARRAHRFLRVRVSLGI
jgi:hypothetical protein